MAYRALYRQYRPTRFSEVIGQNHITTTLKHQVAEGRVAHAYLFCGTRGTGKTTSARILARAVNCLDNQQGEPCGKCSACIAAADENNADIIEIDAASNNGVDDVRALIEKAQYAPMQMRRRVFIIDETHMLSGPAFNALLKTLEEPPAHILFILATTEPQKLPATIISRCQRFDFHRLSVQDIVATLESVLKQANATIDPEGLMLIARTADGGMRDALSLCDQCLSFCGDHVSKQDVYDVLGSMEEGFLFDMADALLTSDAAKALNMLDDIVRGGRDLSVFCQDLAQHFRALLLSRTCGRCENLLSCTADAMDRYLMQSKATSEARLLLSLELLLKAQGDMRYLASPRALLESALVRICRPEDDRSIANLEARIDRLEAIGLSAPAPVQSVPVPPAAEPTARRQAPQTTPQPAPAANTVSVDAPPLPEPPPEASDAPAVKPAPAPSAAQAEARPSAASSPAKPVGSDAAKLWQSVLSNVQSQNMMVYLMAKDGVVQSLTEDTLTVAYPDADDVQYRAVSAAINYNRLQEALSALRPNVRLTLTQKHFPPATGEAAEKAKKLFGDKLVIE